MGNRQHIEWLLSGAESWNDKRRRSNFNPDFSDTNLYHEFKRNGQIPINNYYSLAGFNLDYSNFKNSTLCNQERDRFFDFSKARLNNAMFTEADGGVYEKCSNYNRPISNKGTNFDGTNLQFAEFLNANFSGASFVSSNLFHSNLCGADLFGSTIRNANLCASNLGEANLLSASLSGVNLASTKLYIAHIFDKSEFCGDIGLRIEKYRIESVNCLIDLCSTLEESEKRLYFRGESSTGWKLEPSVMRSNKVGRPYRSYEGQMLLELLSKRPEDFGNSKNALDLWVRAQHHGLKTRMLDITRNPLVALFYACGGFDSTDNRHNGRIHVFSVPLNLIKPFNSDTISIITNFSKLSRQEQNCILGRTSDTSVHPSVKDKSFMYEKSINRLYHFIRQEKSYFMEVIDPRDFFRVFVVEPTQSIERIRSQSGAFLISAFHERMERREIVGRNENTPVYGHVEIDVSRNARERILKELQFLGISRESLFPSLDETAKAITNSIHNKSLSNTKPNF